ncbi:uncharacterized protein LOC128670935 [Plodia interpunctella]|uniref:uncharacterized protein LOC128670935 n=1 Tax=Plodia interpunctella TaxID=58824 RepID=UPI002367C143|nr:uncharacterized protein LOC128670935 [Plodia interpunctella]
MSEVPFPAVTICDPDVVYGPSTENITKILSSRGYNSSQISDFYLSFTAINDIGYSPPMYLKKMHGMLEGLNLPLNALLNLLKKPCDVMLVSCTWRSKVHNCSTMFREVFILSSYCCQFDMTHFQRNAQSNTNFISGMSPNEALEVVVNGRKYLPNGTTEEGHLLVYVLDEQDTITFLDHSLTITPATLFDINVDVWMIDSSEYVKALNVKSRGCILKTDPTYGTGFYHGCMAATVMKHVSEICRCIPYNFKWSDLNVDIRKQCSWERLACIYETTDRVLGNMKGIIAESDCYQRCDYVQYDTDAKYIRQQRRFHDLSNGYSKISVHFNDDICLKYRREVLYTWDQVLANLGGIFGLCLGGSVISLIELVWFIFDILINTINNYFRGKGDARSIVYQNSMMISTIDKYNVGKLKFSN